MDEYPEIVPLNKTKHFQDWVKDKGLQCPSSIKSVANWALMLNLEKFYEAHMEGLGIEKWMTDNKLVWPGTVGEQSEFLMKYARYIFAAYLGKPKYITAVWEDSWQTGSHRHTMSKISRVRVLAHETVVDALERHNIANATTYILVGWPPIHGDTEVITETCPAQ